MTLKNTHKRKLTHTKQQRHHELNKWLQFAKQFDKDTQLLLLPDIKKMFPKEFN